MIRGNRTRNSERKMALWEGLWEGLWKTSENPLKTSESLSPLKTSKHLRTDICWFSLFPGNYSISEAQIFAENHRKPQNFAANCRKPQNFAETRLSRWVFLFHGPYPQYGWDFPEEIPEKFRKDTGNALRAFPGISLESTAGMPQTLSFKAFEASRAFPEFSPSQHGWGRLFFQNWFRRGPLRAGHGIPSSTGGISDFNSSLRRAQKTREGCGCPTLVTRPKIRRTLLGSRKGT